MKNDDTALPPLPDYDNPPQLFWEQNSAWLAPAAVFLLTVLATVFAFPPFDAPETAYVCLAPAILWAYRGPGLKVFLGTTIGAQIVSWYFLTWWLHHATWPGFLLLAPIVGVWVGSWYGLVWWVMPRMLGLPTLNRLAAIAGLAAAWVIIEWTRTTVFAAFPWLPLSASQWERSSILQVAAFTGAGGVSFALVLMNLGFAACAHRLYFETDLKGFRKRSQEMLFGFFGLMVCLSLHVQEAVNRFQFHEPVAKVGFVQPNVPQEVKWNPENGPAIVRTLQQATETVANRNADVILWPEAVTPWAIVGGDPTVRQFVEHTASVAETPIMLGSIAIEPPEAGEVEERWLNGAFVVDPEKGLDPNYYAKRKLVPFGEYVPLRGLLGWLEKVVPIGGDFEAGDSASPLLFFADDEIYSAAPLICYEDTFPALARKSMIASPDLFIVFTNNGWFGESGAAEQHAAHSVLRAVETRRPVLRIGNAGWSGWIDEFGVVRAVLRKVNRERTDGSVRQVVSTKVEDVEGTIYFRGSATVDVERDSRWVGRRSFYLQHGDWFILACAGLALFGWFMIKAGQTLLQARRDP